MKTETFYGEIVGDVAQDRVVDGAILPPARYWIARRDDPRAMRIRRYGMIPRHTGERAALPRSKP